jgi:hypothetical protein
MSFGVCTILSSQKKMLQTYICDYDLLQAMGEEMICGVKTIGN